MQLDELLKRLGLPPETAGADWAAEWDADEAALEGAPDVLDPGYVRDAAERLAVSRELEDVLLDVLPGLRENPAVRRLAHHLVHRMRSLQRDPGRLAAEAGQWPQLTSEGCGVRGAELLPVFVWFGGVSWIEDFYRRHGIPTDVLRATMRDIDIWVDHHLERTGRRGLVQNRWLANHFSGNLFRLGRLQFQFGTFRYPYHAWRGSRHGAVVLLADSGLRFSRDGLEARWEADGTELPLAAEYQETDDAVCGLPVHPRGFAMPENVRLDRSAWRPVLTVGDPVLNLHIPAGEPMTFDACGESLAQAIPFFQRHFPEYAWHAFACGSWLLDPQFDGRLRETSNIVRFLREFYLFPLPGATGDSHFERVFGTREVDPRTAPRDTSLRRVLLEFVEAGGRWRAGGGVIFPEDLAWGRRVYRRMFEHGLPV